MKKLAILTSILALTACGGGSGGGHGGSTYQPEILKPENVITEDMLTQNAELAKKLQTIEYVENNLGNLESNNTISTQSVQTGRGASGKYLNMTLSDFETRYQKALAYFDVLEKIMNKSGRVTIKDIKIAYSLAANKPLKEIDVFDLPGISIEQFKDDTYVIDVETLLSNLKIYITDRVETNIDLKDSATQDIKKGISELASTEAIDPNASLINPELLKNLDNLDHLKDMFTEFSFEVGEDDKIKAIYFDEDENGNKKFYVERVGNTSVFKSDGDLWFFDYQVCNSKECKNLTLEGLTEQITDPETLAQEVEKALLEEDDDKNFYNSLSNDEKSAFLQGIKDGSNGEWFSAPFIGDLHSLGKVNGLKYSDFGHYKLDQFDFTFTYEGGINEHKINKDNMPTDEKLVFHGTAAGELQSNSYAANKDEKRSDNMLIVTDTGKATLTFDNGKETMHLPFNNWYTVDVEQVQKDGEGFINRIKFTDDNNMFENGKNKYWKLAYEDVKYGEDPSAYINHDHENETQTTYSIDEDNIASNHTVLNTTYYHENEIPVEATATLNHVEEGVPFTDENDPDVVERQIWFTTTFGGTKQQ